MNDASGAGSFPALFLAAFGSSMASFTHRVTMRRVTPFGMCVETVSVIHEHHCELVEPL
jgi:hypothetical protein